ncbi:MAG: ornithine cyclodeaminase family protein [Candidatus Bathyarchaeota archaeon]|nr:ornithine cyclodeaminase family protein [Candidatus Bathyarchaeota archaeon]
MKRVEMLYLSQEDILDMEIPIREIIPLVEKGLKEHCLDQVENPPKPGIHAKSDSFIHAMPAYYRKLGIGGIKWVSGYPSNRELGLPQILGVMITNDMDTGLPTAIMDCRWITAVRTAAVSAVTAKYCALKGSESFGVIGCGVQGRMNLVALKEIIPTLMKAKAYDINPEASKRYKTDLEKETGVEITPVTSVEEAAKGSDIILTATQRLPNPLVKNEWFKPGALGMGLEASRAWYGDAILTADKFITDSWDQTVHFHEQGAFPEGMPKLYAELGEIVAGKKKGRENSKERILAINIGLALEDVIVADYVYKKAKKKGGYQKLTLMERDF